MNPPYPRVWLSDHGIVHVEFAPHCQINRQLIKQVCQKRFEIADEPAPIMVVAKKVSGYDVDATLYLAKEAVKDANLAYAIVIDSFLTDFIANEFMRYHKPPCPVEIFEQEQVATEWLLKFVKK